MSLLRRGCAASQVVRRIAARSLGALLAGVGLAAAPLAAQEAPPPERVTVQGQVIDHATGQPVAGALVEVEKLHYRATTDREGRFTVRKVRPGEQELTVTRLGYQGEVTTVWVVPGAETVAIRLRPDPVVLEGLTVKMDLLDRRQRRTPYSSRVFGRSALASTASASVLDFVQTHGGVIFLNCGEYSFERDCAYSRGSLIRPAVYLDEMPNFGVEGLRGVRPWEVERVEVYQGGRQIRIYTSAFLELAARGKQYISPVLF